MMFPPDQAEFGRKLVIAGMLFFIALYAFPLLKMAWTAWVGG